MEIRCRQPRTATLWTLAAFIIVADQLSKAWFVFRLGNLHGIKTFGEFLPRYLSEFNTRFGGEYSIIFDKYYSHLRAEDINVLGEWIRFYLPRYFVLVLVAFAALLIGIVTGIQ